MLPALHLVAVYVGTICLSLWLVHRFVRKLSRPAVAGLLILPLTLPGAALFQGKVYAPMDLLYEHAPWSDVAQAHDIEPSPSIAGDLPFQIVPWHLAVRDAWSAGDWPIWNPYILAGDLLAASAQPAPYHPLNILSLLLPLDLSLTYQAAAMLFLAALGAFLFCRELECGELASLVGAASWMLSGFLMFWLLWPMAAAVATMPWIAAGVWRLPRFGLLTTGLTLLLLSGHPESMLHVTATGCVLGLLVIVLRYRAPGRAAHERLGRMVKLGTAAALAGLIAGGLSAIHLLPILDALPETGMYKLRQEQFARQDHSVPWPVALERMNTAVLPFRFGIVWSHHRLPTAGFFIPMSSAYVGTVALGLALLGLWRGGLAQGRAVRWFFAAWAGVGVAAGAGTPGVTHLLAALPLFDLSIHRRWVFAAAWALSALAALGAEAFLRRSRESPRTSYRDLAVCSLVATIVAGTSLWENWQEMRSPAGATGLTSAFLAHHSLLLLAPPLLATVAALAASRIRAVVPLHLGWLLLLLLVGQRSLESAGRYPTLDRDDAFPEVPIVAAIPPSDTPERVVGVGFTFLANTSTFYGLEDVRGYQPMSSRIYGETFPLWDTRPQVFFNEVHSLDSPFLDFLGVRWAIAPRQLTADHAWRRVEVARSVQLMENAQALPRAFLPQRIFFDLAEPLRPMADVQDFAEVAFIDTPAPNRPEGLAVSNGRGSVTTKRHGTGLWLNVRLEDPAWVVISQPHWRGWRALRHTADGGREELPVLTANHAFLALHLPAGPSDVELFFSPSSFRIGRTLTLATLLLLVTASLLRRRIRTEA
ncbi:MAG: hypothetical protein MPN21_14625 [Thermoanaerobaculia bacterium]|nr:hypothetical protein [Thermoanaerobaculia bacterium]